MIEFHTYGPIKNRSVIERFIALCLDYLLPYPYKRNISITVEFVRNMENYGECLGDRNEATITISKYDEDGNYFDLRNLLLNIAHELVHAKQFIKGQLSPSTEKWKGVKVVAPYRKTPWEKEAYLMEDKLVKMFYDEV